MARFSLCCCALLAASTPLLAEESPQTRQASTRGLVRVSEPLTAGPTAKTVVSAPLGWQPWTGVNGRSAAGSARYYTVAGKTRLEVDLGREVVPGPIRLVRLASPPRAYFDLAFGGPQAPESIALDTAEVSGLRFGLHASDSARTLRCVIDLQNDAVEITSVRLEGGKLLVEASGG